MREPDQILRDFADLSGDITADEFFVLVGNERGQPLEKITLRRLLGNLRAYLHDPSSWKGSRTFLQRTVSLKRELDWS